MFFSLENKVAVVTGGVSGIGRAICERFAATGAKVVIVDRRDGAELAEKLGCDSVVADVSREADVRQALDFAITKCGRLDILINNAAIQPLGVSFDEVTEELLNKAFQVNVNSVAFGIKHAGRLMNDGGRIVNTASFIGLLGAPKAAVYAPTRAAVIHMTRLAAMELAPRKITVNCVCPGTVNTPAVLDIPNNPEIPFIERMTPLGRLGKPEEIAAAFHFLASDDAAYVTGAIFPVDGGITAGWKEHDVVSPANIVEGTWRD